MQQWIKCILVLTFKIAIVGAQCPSGYTCSSSSCYLIYPTAQGWKYIDTQGIIHDAEENVYASPNCYKFIRVINIPLSCIEAQRECEKVGGNITVINSIREYEQLTSNVLNVLTIEYDSTFNVHVQNLPHSGCATITVEDGTFSNSKDIRYTDCTTARTVNSIVCESTGVQTGICSVPQTTEKTPKPTTEVKTVPTLPVVAVIVSCVLVTIAMTLLYFLLARRRQKRKKIGRDKPVDKVEYHEDFAAKDIHEYASLNSVNQNQDTADEIAYQDLKDNNECLFNDTAAAEDVYHGAAVNVVYQNSAVDRSKRTGNRKEIVHAMVGGQTSPSCSSQPLSHKEDSVRRHKVTSSPDGVDIPYEISPRAPGSRGSVQCSDDYSEMNAIMPNKNKDEEPNHYLQTDG